MTEESASSVPPRRGDRLWNGWWMSPAEFRAIMREINDYDRDMAAGLRQAGATRGRLARAEDEAIYADQRRAEEEDDE